MCSRALGGWICSILVPSVLWLPSLTVVLCLTSSSLPSLSSLAVPDRMALSLSLCLRLTITPIPLKGGQGLANRWRACGVLLLWLSCPTVCCVPPLFACWWLHGLWQLPVSLCQGPFHVGINSYMNVTEQHIVSYYFKYLLMFYLWKWYFETLQTKTNKKCLQCYGEEAVLRISY